MHKVTTGNYMIINFIELTDFRKPTIFNLHYVGVQIIRLPYYQAYYNTH